MKLSVHTYHRIKPNFTEKQFHWNFFSRLSPQQKQQNVITWTRPLSIGFSGDCFQRIVEMKRSKSKSQDGRKENFQQLQTLHQSCQTKIEQIRSVSMIWIYRRRRILFWMRNKKNESIFRLKYHKFVECLCRQNGENKKNACPSFSMMILDA